VAPRDEPRLLADPPVGESPYRTAPPVAVPVHQPEPVDEPADELPAEPAARAEPCEICGVAPGSVPLVLLVTMPDTVSGPIEPDWHVFRVCEACRGRHLARRRFRRRLRWALSLLSAGLLASVFFGRHGVTGWSWTDVLSAVLTAIIGFGSILIAAGHIDRRWGLRLHRGPRLGTTRVFGERDDAL